MGREDDEVKKSQVHSNVSCNFLSMGKMYISVALAGFHEYSFCMI